MQTSLNPEETFVTILRSENEDLRSQLNKLKELSDVLTKRLVLFALLKRPHRFFRSKLTTFVAMCFAGWPIPRSRVKVSTHV